MRKKRLCFWVGLAVGVPVLLSPLLPAWAQTDWYRLKAGGHTIGNLRIHSYRQADKEGSAIVTEISNTNRFNRDGNPFAMNITGQFIESATDGKPLRFSYQYNLNEQNVLAAQGEMLDGTLNLHMLQNNETHSGNVPISAGQFIFPDGARLQNMYHQHFHDHPGSRFHFQTLHWGVSPQIVDSEVTVLGAEKLALGHGVRKQVNKFQIQNRTAQANAIYEWRDISGKLYKAQSVGDAMEMEYASSRDIGQDPTDLDLVASSAIPTMVIPQPRITYEALYRIAPLNGQSMALDGLFPETALQTRMLGAQESSSGKSSQTGDIISESPTVLGPAVLGQVKQNALYLKVIQKEPADVSVPYPINLDAMYLQSTPYVQASDPAMVSTALDAIGTEKRAYYAARKLQQWVYQNVRNKNFSQAFASAKDVLSAREGDCTEHAVLLAALTRSVGIPSRVAIGLIYLPDSNQHLGRFVYHMWTEVYIGTPENGEWTPLDATNPEAQPDATHIKLADSPLSDTNDLMTLTRQVTQVMGKIRIDVVKALSPAQSVLTIGTQYTAQPVDGTSTELTPGILQAAIPKLDLESLDIRTLTEKSIKHYRVALPPKAMSLDTPEGLFTHGVEQLAQDNYNAAITSFNKAIALSKHPTDLYRMGERLAAIEINDLAADAFQRAKRSDSRFAPLVDNWLTVYLSPDSLPDALHRQYIKAVSLQLDRQDAVGTAELLHGILEQSPNFAPAYWHLGQVTEGKDAISALRQAIVLAPDDYRYQETLGDALMSQRQYSAAARAYRQAYTLLKPQAIAHGKPWLDDLQGKAKLASGSAAVTANQRNAAGWLEIGQGLLLQDRPKDAKTAIDNALALQPGYPAAQVERFALALSVSDWPTLAQYQGNLSAMASNRAALLLGQYHTRTRHYDAALQSLQRAGAQPETYLAMSNVYLRKAQRQDALGKPGANGWRQQAENILRSGIARLPQADQKLPLQLALAERLLEGAKAEEAQTLAEAALDADPLNAQAYRLKGQTQLYRDTLPQARETLEIARNLNPNDEQTLIQLGNVAMEEGRDALALDFYRKAYTADPGSLLAAETLRNTMTRMNVAGKKPPAYLNLSDDEYDYLVQALSVIKQMKAREISFLNQLNQMMGDVQPDFNLHYIEAVKTANKLSSQAYDRDLAWYRQLEAMPVPLRLADFHYQLMQASHQRLDADQFRIKDFGTLFDKSAHEALKDEEARLNAEHKAMVTNFDAAQKSLIAQLAPTMVVRLKYEAQLNDIAEMDAEITRLSESLKEKLSPSSPAHVKPSATPKNG